jgi:hypothetical protein
MFPTTATRMGHAHFALHVRHSLCPSHLLRRRHAETLAHPTTATAIATTCESLLRPCLRTRLTTSHAHTDSTLHSLAHPVALRPNTASCSREQTRNTNHDPSPGPYNHRHIAAQHANRLSPTAQCQTLAHVCINVPLQHKERRRRAPCPLEVRAWTSTRRAVCSGISKRQKSFRHHNTYRIAYKNAGHETHDRNEHDNQTLALE